MKKHGRQRNYSSARLRSTLNGERHDPKYPTRKHALTGTDDRSRIAQEVQDILNTARLEQQLYGWCEPEGSSGERPVGDHRGVEVSLEVRRAVA